MTPEQISETNTERQIIETLAAGITDCSARGIATAVEKFIRDDTLTPGTRMPTVRRIAERIGVSAATVSAAWTLLRRERLLRTDRRRGTIIEDLQRSQAQHDFPGWESVSLAQALPDYRLLPPVDAAFSASAKSARTFGDDNLHVTSHLRGAIENTWPYRAERFAVANGGYEGTLLALRAIIQPGTSVAVEQPTAPRILEILRAVKATPIAVQCDSEGPLPDSVSAALDRRPSVLIYQPRNQIPSGCTVTARRMYKLAEIIRQARHPVAVLEDDNIGPAAGKTTESIGTILPDCTIVVRSYCKAYGIDLRTCVISGPEPFIRRIDRLQALSMMGTSRILQNALAYMLRDPATEQRLDVARDRYRQRRSALATQLTHHGVSVAGGAGLTLWVSVADERIAMNSLLQQRITVGRGSKCTIGGNDTTHLQVATAALPDDRELIDDLARAIAAAGRPVQVQAAG